MLHFEFSMTYRFGFKYFSETFYLSIVAVITYVIHGDHTKLLIAIPHFTKCINSKSQFRILDATGKCDIDAFSAVWFCNTIFISKTFQAMRVFFLLSINTGLLGVYRVRSSRYYGFVDFLLSFIVFLSNNLLKRSLRQLHYLIQITLTGYKHTLIMPIDIFTVSNS